jgi:hypothetical protein
LFNRGQFLAWGRLKGHKTGLWTAPTLFRATKTGNGNASGLSLRGALTHNPLYVVPH